MAASTDDGRAAGRRRALRDRDGGVDVRPTISCSIDIDAAPALVWSMVTDLPRMGDFSPENIGGHWVGQASCVAPGARFRGTNRNGRRQWSTRVRVVGVEPGHSFTFDVRTPFGVRVSRWSYAVDATATGCRLTENWYRVGGRLMRRLLGPLVTGRADRRAYNLRSVRHTLAAVKACAEDPNTPPVAAMATRPRRVSGPRQYRAFGSW